MPKAYSTYTSLGQQQAFDNEADKSFVPHKAEATNVVNEQKAFEASKTADVAARNDANTAETQALRNHVGATKTQKHNEFSNYYVYVPEEEVYINLETPVESYAAKAESLEIAKATAMKQLYDMDAW
jgi:Asp-tRNA(Asn)/Glu-tRNA(Gln) amidotransferase B subunit